ncbi:glycosyltransferase [Primorskyibacter sp. S87]|uniref:glycosyltransferase n=1 Tax=Primorskyibacter sp. S87 TaxID=3415126 RepID=UPI003C7B78E4
MSKVAAVVIGRNEGDRLSACLRSLTEVRQVIYVDSGSTDGSVERARNSGAEVVELDMSRPFTAARARNAGISVLHDAEVEFVQMVDGDCELAPGWISAALTSLDADPGLVAVCGRRRERHPEASVYNRLCDREWDTPIGLTNAFGGDAMIRLDALRQAGLYREDLIAGEEPELCVRLRQAGGRIQRLDAEMTRHDANMHQFTQWWRRARRAGHAFAEGAALHGRPPERHWVKETRRAVLWGLALPLVIAIGTLTTPHFLLLLLAYPVQILRLARREGGDRAAWENAVFTTLAKFPEAQGVLEFHLNHLRGRKRGLIEYQ